MGAHVGIFEVRLKSGDRTFSRHYTVKTGEQAAKRAKGKGKILSVRKIHSSDVIGTIESMNLQNIIGIPRGGDTINEGTTIDSLIFNRQKPLRKNNNSRY